MTDVGERVSAASTVGLILKSAAFVLEPSVAVTFTVVRVVTPVVGMLNVAEFDPDAIVTALGAVANGESSVSKTVIPAAGATEFTVTVPFGAVPPLTVPGAIVNVVIIGG